MRSLFISLLALILFNSANSQELTGTWQGILLVGGKNIRLVFHISKTETNTYSATLDSPDQNAYGIKCSNTKIAGDSLVIEMDQMKATYKGMKLDADFIEGFFSQGAANFKMSIKRLKDADVPVSEAQKVKSQTPKPPFDYVTEEVIYVNTLQKIKLGGTLTKPKGGGKFPVVLMITGSGPQDRDETIGMHKPFWVIADYLTKQGIAVLRVDDRGMGKSSGNFSGSTSADFATDVMAGLDYLKTRKDIDTSKMGLIGHSEGGFIAPYVAARRKDVAFIVMLAGPMVGGKQTMYYQAVEKPLAMLSEHDRKAYGQLYTSMIDYAINPKGDKDMSAFIKKTYTDWKKNLPDSTIKNLIKGTDEETIKAMVNGFSDLKRAWWHFFLTYDIASDLKKVQIPIFALNGSKDEQVDPKENLSLIKHILAQNKNPRYQVYEVRGLNHLFQHCKECGSVKEYLELDETFDQNTLTVIGTWIKQMLKKPEILQ